MNPKTLPLLFALGRPFSPIYALSMKIRAFLYRNGVLRSHALGVPIISVGNLVMGGSGKTPLVIYIAQLLQKHGYRPGIISRGYKGAARAGAQIVSDGHTLLLDAHQAGDEPYLLASRLSGVAVATGRKRLIPCREAVSACGCNVLILDDGFQHLAVRRDLDLVLFDVNHFAGNSRVFPGGELREPIGALHRCSAFVLTGVSAHNRERADKCAAMLSTRFAQKPVFQATRGYSGMTRYSWATTGHTSRQVDLDELPRPLYGFCAIARPERFEASLAEYRIDRCGLTCFGDHHRYRKADLQAINQEAADRGAKGLITTDKDVVKLLDLGSTFDLPLYVPIMEIPEQPELDRFILASLTR